MRRSGSQRGVVCTTGNSRRVGLSQKALVAGGAFRLLISGCMGLSQFLFLDGRSATLQDLVTNTSGAVLGALLARVAVERLEARNLSATDL